MSGDVCWFVELALRPGARKDFLRLTEEMVETSRQEPGTLIYERALNADQDVVIAHEWYESSEAALTHLRRFHAEFGSRFSALIERKAFIVVGDVSAELRAALSSVGARVFVPGTGFSRLSGTQPKKQATDGSAPATG
jgi:quinol monooxygenase YgiN